MKRILPTLLTIVYTIFLGACNKPLNKYTISIDRYEQSVITGGRDLTTKKEVIMAADDITAYQKGLTKYYGGLVAEKLVPSAGYQSKSFTVTDTSGMDVTLRLPQKSVDSLTKMVQRYTDDELKRLKH